MRTTFRTELTGPHGRNGDQPQRGAEWPDATPPGTLTGCTLSQEALATTNLTTAGKGPGRGAPVTAPNRT